MVVLDHGYVNLVESWGSDAHIIEAARMSTNKGFQGWGVGGDCEAWSVDDWLAAKDIVCDKGTKGCLKHHVGDEKLLRYLWAHGHHTPFEMGGIVLEVQAPIMVFREWQRHRTQSYNELSARYTALPDLFYLPSIERIMSGAGHVSNRQSSGGAISNETARTIQDELRTASESARGAYERLLRTGLSRELARLVVPVNQYSRMRASANLRNWLAFLTLRCADGAQWEMRQFADAVAGIVAKLFPRTHDLWGADGRE